MPLGATRSRPTQWPRGGHLWFASGLRRRHPARPDVDRRRRPRSVPASVCCAGPGRGRPGSRTDRTVAGPTSALQRRALVPGDRRAAAARPTRVAGAQRRHRRQHRYHSCDTCRSAELAGACGTCARELPRAAGGWGPGSLATLGSWCLALLLLGPFAVGACEDASGDFHLDRRRDRRAPRSIGAWFRRPGSVAADHGPGRVATADGRIARRCGSSRSPPLMRTTEQDTANLVEARRSAAAGRLLEAWAVYRRVAPNAALLPELYDLAMALGAQNLST